MVALATFELLDGVQRSFTSAYAVIAASERLDALDVTATTATGAWPAETVLALSQVELPTQGEKTPITVTIRPGSHVAVTGDSGSGKSTLLRIMAGLEDASTGTVSVGGKLLASLSEEETRTHIAYVPSDVALVRGYVHDVLGMGRKVTRDALADLSSLGLSLTPSDFIEDLSRGERARLGIVRATATSPGLILLDEPTAGLGPTETTAILQLLATTSATVIVATHDPLVVAWCDQAIIL
jgi:ABC-type lipoprotein export system ATPase subunit